MKLDLPRYMRTYPVIHVSLTKPAIDKPLELVAEVLTRSDAFERGTDGTPLFKAKQILSHRSRGRGYQWLTLMEGEETYDAEWQSSRDFVDTEGAIKEAFRDYIQEQELLSELRQKPG